MPNINFKNLNLIMGSNYKTQVQKDLKVLRSKPDIQRNVYSNQNSSTSSDASQDSAAGSLVSSDDDKIKEFKYIPR